MYGKVPGENWMDHTNQVSESMELEEKSSFAEGARAMTEEPKWDWMVRDGMEYWMCS